MAGKKAICRFAFGSTPACDSEEEGGFGGDVWCGVVWTCPTLVWGAPLALSVRAYGAVSETFGEKTRLQLTWGDSHLADIDSGEWR